MAEELRRAYSEEDIDRGLQATARLGPDKAAGEVGIPRGTLAEWAYTSHRDRYQLIKDARQSEAARELAVQFEDNTRRALELQAELLDGIATSSLAHRPIEAAKVAANLTKVSATAAEKMQMLRDRPTHIVSGPKNIDEIDESFKQRFGEDWAKRPGWDADSTAVEDPGPHAPSAQAA